MKIRIFGQLEILRGTGVCVHCIQAQQSTMGSKRKRGVGRITGLIR